MTVSAGNGSLSLLMVRIDDLQRVACRDHAVSQAEEEADALSDVHPLSVYAPRDHRDLRDFNSPCSDGFRPVMFQLEISSPNGLGRGAVGSGTS
jgi:hypothetical protein